MNTWQPLVSVIIPAYGQAAFLADAVLSVLNQTYVNIEVIVVNDASPDDTDAVMQSLMDRRVTYLVHRRNLGLPAARNTGIRASRGELIALLDADDYFHPEKIDVHVALLRERPAVGLSYNARFNLHPSSRTIRDIWRPALHTDLHDLVLGFPFAPSDVVVRRSWLDRIGPYDERLLHSSEDLDLHSRLALAGCQCAGVSRALTFRRYHAGRRFDVVVRHRAETSVLDRTFQDPRCPASVRRRRTEVIAAHTRCWAWRAFYQRDTEVGVRLIRHAVQLDPGSQYGGLPSLLEDTLSWALEDHTVSHELTIDMLLSQLPAELCSLRRHRNQLVGTAYLQRATRALFWDSADRPEACLARAADAGVMPDDAWVQGVLYDAESVAINRGRRRADTGIVLALDTLRASGHSRLARHLAGAYAFTQALQTYRCGEYRNTLSHLRQAVWWQPTYLHNRGALSIGVRSLIPALRRVDSAMRADSTDA
jgi:glycosyltransferase involved in cell wall biosynthesis